jgi:hypothetical protein
MREYLLLLDHPASNIPITPTEETAVTKKIPMSKSNDCKPGAKGKTEMIINTVAITMYGARL